MALLLDHAALRTYDALKGRARGLRRSDARDAEVLAIVSTRLRELIDDYRLTTQQERGNLYVFWSEILNLLETGAFDDLRERL